jgi:hypothetical protein
LHVLGQLDGGLDALQGLRRDLGVALDRLVLIALHADDVELAPVELVEPLVALVQPVVDGREAALHVLAPIIERTLRLSRRLGHRRPSEMKKAAQLAALSSRMRGDGK